MALNFRLAIILLVLFNLSCVDVSYNKDINVRLYDTKRIKQNDIFIWTTYLNRIKNDKFTHGDYFIVGYYTDHYNKLYQKLISYKPIIKLNNIDYVKITKLNHTQLLKKFPFANKHSVNYLVKFKTDTSMVKKLTLRLNDKLYTFTINLED